MTGESSSVGLVRAIGRWTLAALVLNSIVGSGIFGLPREVIALVGSAAPLACLVAAAGIGVVMACFAEVGSQFREAGGPYLFARTALGRFAGVQMGWFALLVRLTSAAANASLFVTYLGEFVPEVAHAAARGAILALLIGTLAVVNVRGVTGGAAISNAFTAAKLVPLGLFVVVGLAGLGGAAPPVAASASSEDWGRALLALVFAYGGFEAALIPLGEARNPRRDVPFALFVALAACAALYTLVHVVVLDALGDTGTTARPLAEAARVLLGGPGAALIAVGALVSIYGYLGGQMVSAPRLPFALAERGDFPAFLATVHPRFHTPWLAIALYALLVWVLALTGGFLWNAILSAVARLLTYGMVCAALIVLRRRAPAADALRLPAGPVWAIVGMAFCVVLASRMGHGELVAVGLTCAIALGNWYWAHRRTMGSSLHFPR